MKHTIITGFSALLLLAVGLVGCSKEEALLDTPDPWRSPITISVSDGGYVARNNSDKTRSTESGYITQFAAGDQIGLYAVVDGAIVAQNICLTATYNGSGGVNWTGAYYEGTTAKYFAYYPYRTTLTGTLTPSATDAEGFFAGVVSQWTPAPDQSSPAKYTAQDLMVGSGTASQQGSVYALSLAMTHAMALVVIETPMTKYTLSTDANYTWITEAPDTKFYGFTPCFIDGKYRLLVKPSQSGASELMGSYTAADGNAKEYFLPQNGLLPSHYVHYCVDGGGITLKEHTLQMGDFYLEDGSLVAYDATLSDVQKAACIGVVFQTDQNRIGTGEKNVLGGTAHGLVMALKNASTPTIWGPSSVDLSLTNCETKSQCYSDISGYDNCSVVKAANSDLSNYPAFKAADDYNTTCPALGISTGWFLPSVGQWWDILQHLGGLVVFADSNEQTSPASGDFNWSGQGDILAMLNAWISQIPARQKDVFDDLGVWSSSEYDGHNARNVYFYSSGNLKMHWNHKSTSNTVRTVLAF